MNQELLRSALAWQVRRWAGGPGLDEHQAVRLCGFCARALRWPVERIACLYNLTLHDPASVPGQRHASPPGADVVPAALRPLIRAFRNRNEVWFASKVPRVRLPALGPADGSVAPVLAALDQHPEPQEPVVLELMFVLFCFVGWLRGTSARLAFVLF